MTFRTFRAIGMLATVLVVIALGEAIVASVLLGGARGALRDMYFFTGIAILFLGGFLAAGHTMGRKRPSTNVEPFFVWQRVRDEATDWPIIAIGVLFAVVLIGSPKFSG